MASGINLGAARVVLAAIALTQGNRKKFNNIGTLQALRSPQVADLIREVSPVNAKNDNRLSIQSGQSTPLARVTLNYRPQIDSTIGTSRTVSTGDNPTQATSLNVDYNTYRQVPLTYRTVDRMAMEKEAEDYLKQVNQGNLNVNLGSFRLISEMGDQIMRRMDKVLQNVNNAALTTLVSAVAGNLLIGATSPTNTAVPSIVAFNNDGSLNPYFWDWLNNLKTVHGFEGRPIVVGGLKLLSWMQRKQIASPAALGYDYAAMYDSLDVEFYYDPAVDTISGQDHVLVIDPGAACLETILEHQLIIQDQKIAQTTYGTASISVAQTDAPTFMMDMDIRVREENLAYPQWTITPSMRFGVFTRPMGFHKTYDGWDTVNGIFRAKLV